MPVMGGVEATEILKREQPLTPVVIVTASSDAIILDKCRTAGANVVMHKPFTFETLAAQLKQLTKYVLSDLKSIQPFCPARIQQWQNQGPELAGMGRLRVFYSRNWAVEVKGGGPQMEDNPIFVKW